MTLKEMFQSHPFFTTLFLGVGLTLATYAKLQQLRACVETTTSAERAAHAAE